MRTGSGATDCFLMAIRFNSWLGGAFEIYSQGEAMISLPCKIQGIMKASEAAFDPLRKFGSVLDDGS